MNELISFDSPLFGSVRTLCEDDRVLFCAKDIAFCLGYASTANAIRRHCKSVIKRTLMTDGGPQELAFIGESDVYRLVARSKLVAAETFECWIFEEVLPSVRKYGGYLTPAALESALLNPDVIIKLATDLKRTQEQNKALIQSNTEMLPKAEYYDDCISKDGLTGLRETAKLFGIPPKAFVSFLLSKKYLYRDSKGNLMPYAYHLSVGWFKTKEVHNPEHPWIGTQTYVTARGRAVLKPLFKSIA